MLTYTKKHDILKKKSQIMKKYENERPFERIGLRFVTLINPCELHDEEFLEKSYHLSTTIVDGNGIERETSIMISLGELKDDGINIKIADALYNLNKSYGYIYQYLINVAKIKSQNILDSQK